MDLSKEEGTRKVEIFKHVDAELHVRTGFGVDVEGNFHVLHVDKVNVLHVHGHVEGNLHV